MTPSDPLSLVTWRRVVSDLYGSLREEVDNDPRRAWSRFRCTRDVLFAQHPQTPLSTAQLQNFSGIPYYPYDPAWHISGQLDHDIAGSNISIELGADGTLRLTSIAYVHFRVDGQPHRLTLYWIEGYGGGLFLPFRDKSCGDGTYGGGRYLYDTIKGADLGVDGDRIMLDFNFAYNPSCAYNSQWICPLSPPANHLNLLVKAGERAWIDPPNEPRQQRC